MNKFKVEKINQRHEILTWKTLNMKEKTTGPSPVKIIR